MADFDVANPVGKLGSAIIREAERAVGHNVASGGLPAHGAPPFSTWPQEDETGEVVTMHEFALDLDGLDTSGPTLR